MKQENHITRIPKKEVERIMRERRREEREKQKEREYMDGWFL